MISAGGVKVSAFASLEGRGRNALVAIARSPEPTIACFGEGEAILVRGTSLPRLLPGVLRRRAPRGDEDRLSGKDPWFTDGEGLSRRGRTRSCRRGRERGSKPPILSFAR